MRAYVLICEDTRCVPGCFNSCHQRIHAFIVPVKLVLCFTKSYLDLSDTSALFYKELLRSCELIFLFNLVSCLALGS